MMTRRSRSREHEGLSKPKVIKQGTISENHIDRNGSRLTAPVRAAIKTVAAKNKRPLTDRQVKELERFLAAPENQPPAKLNAAEKRVAQKRLIVAQLKRMEPVDPRVNEVGLKEKLPALDKGEMIPLKQSASSERVNLDRVRKPKDPVLGSSFSRIAKEDAKAKKADVPKPLKINLADEVNDLLGQLETLHVRLEDKVRFDSLGKPKQAEYLFRLIIKNEKIAAFLASQKDSSFAKSVILAVIKHYLDTH